MVWTQATGMIDARYLAGDLPEAELWTTNRDGSVAVGYSGLQATIWTPNQGLQPLQAVLTTKYGLGSELSGWSLTSANGISSDGRVIAGVGMNPNGDQEGWVVVLPGPLTGLHSPRSSQKKAGEAVQLKGRQSGRG